VRFFFLKRTSALGFDSLKIIGGFFKCGFELDSSRFNTLQFRFCHIFSNSKTSSPI
jgi:hypothetical protein